jgi:hypothetical protein
MKLYYLFSKNYSFKIILITFNDHEILINHCIIKLKVKDTIY